jgi:ABC-type nitrate/sulfonate/bicarbonate transport system substrate-binding protein
MHFVLHQGLQVVMETTMRSRITLAALILLLAAALTSAQGVTLRVGYFPNVTHAQALAAELPGNLKKRSVQAFVSTGKSSMPVLP